MKKQKIKVLEKEPKKSLWNNRIFRYWIAVLLCLLIIITTVIMMFIPVRNYIYGQQYLRKIAAPFFMRDKQWR